MGEIAVIHENRPLSAAEIKTQVQIIQQVISAVMKQDVHYGVIPGTKKNTLYKAGSEKILATFRIAVDPVVEDLSTPDCYRYRVTARGVLPSGEIVGAGVGECSTDEEKYKWRSAVCDEEFDSTPETMRRIKWLKGWNNQPAKGVKQVRTNPADLANTVLKMAKKRAQIDLTLTATGASDVFEQDLEELPDELREELTREGQPQRGKPEVRPPQSKSQNQPAQEGTINENQKKLLYVKLKQAKVTEEAFNRFYEISSVSDLPAKFMNEALKCIAEGRIPEAPAEKTPDICPDCREPLKDGKCHTASCPNAEPE